MAYLFCILTYIRVQRIFEKEKKCRAETWLNASVVDMILKFECCTQKWRQINKISAISTYFFNFSCQTYARTSSQSCPVSASYSRLKTSKDSFHAIWQVANRKGQKKRQGVHCAQGTILEGSHEGDRPKYWITGLECSNMLGAQQTRALMWKDISQLVCSDRHCTSSPHRPGNHTYWQANSQLAEVL